MRICLDTNVWTFLAETGEIADFEKTRRREGWTVVLPPATLMEASRTRDPNKRRAILAAMVAGPRVHTRTEAAAESAEFVSEVSRLRPSWLWTRPGASARARELDDFWMRKVPNLARRDPDELAARTAVTEGVWGDLEADISLATTAQKKTQAELRIRELRASLDLMEVAQSPESDPNDWVGLPAGARIEAWRWQNGAFYWRKLSVDARYGAPPFDTTRADWVEPYVNLPAMRRDRRNFNALWFKEIEAARIPRNWLRWAVGVAQLNYRVGHGNPTDEQQAAYLPDTDVYVTADRRFAILLQEVLRAAPTPMATVQLTDRNMGSAVEAIRLSVEVASRTQTN